MHTCTHNIYIYVYTYVSIYVQNMRSKTFIGQSGLQNVLGEKRSFLKIPAVIGIIYEIIYYHNSFKEKCLNVEDVALVLYLLTNFSLCDVHDI